MPVGTGGIPGKPALTVSSLPKRSLATIQNDDNLCLPRALIVARAHLTLKTQDCAATKSLRRRAAVPVVLKGRKYFQTGTRVRCRVLQTMHETPSV